MLRLYKQLLIIFNMKHKIYSLVFITSASLLTPFIAAAQFKNFASTVISLLNKVVTIVMGFALLFFIVGVIRFIATAGDDNSRAEGKQMMIWGTVSLFAMVSVWGLVEIIRATFFG